MPHTIQKQKAKTTRHDVRRTSQPEHNPPQAEKVNPFRVSPRTAGLVLMILTLVYAFLSGLRTVNEVDMGFHLATGRYIVQHHVIPSSDVLSYTAAGAEWIYPPFAEVLLYGIFCAFGYAGLSWLCAVVLAATIGYLLYNFRHSELLIAVVLALMAVPPLALRSTPRPDLFTHLFFAIYLVRLCCYRRCGSGAWDDSAAAQLCRERMQLWILPPVMLLWVNFHPAFIAGLALLSAYLVSECIDLLFPQRRTAVLIRLRHAWPPVAAAALATLLNPFGYKIFKASLLIGGLQQAHAQGSNVVLEWRPNQPSSAILSLIFDWRNPASSFWWLVLVALVVIVLALGRRNFGTAVLMAAALYAAVAHNRLQGLFSIVVVVVGSTTLAEALASKESQGLKANAIPLRLWYAAPFIAMSALCLLTCVRIADLVSNRFYVEKNETTLFGPGESWWFPERAAAFIQQEHLPGNIFQSYIMGGFTAWRLGPDYRDFIDGRFDHLAPAVFTDEQALVSSSVDSPFWKTEADRWNINILLFSLARVQSEETPQLMSLCQSKEWRPIYIDDVSIVLLRNRPANQAWIDRSSVDCQSHVFAPPPHASRIELSNFYANAGYILMQLGRHDEAVESLDRAEDLTPDDPSVHYALAGFYDAVQKTGDAEEEFKTAASIYGYNETILYALGRFYVTHGRYDEALPILVRAAQISTTPANEYCLIGALEMDKRQPEKALEYLAKAEDLGKAYFGGREELNPTLFAQIAAGRAAAYAQMGDWQRAKEFQQEAIRKSPDQAIQSGTAP
jgi:tetratricopeptide (TPR) repeat protein